MTSTARATTTAHAAPPQPVRPPLRLRSADALGLVLAVAVAFAAWPAGAVAVLPLAVAAAVAPALCRIDIGERRLPNALTLPLLAVGAAAGVVRLLSGDVAPLVAVGCGAVLLIMAVVGGMGMGDVKLGAGLALATAPLGWAAPLVGLAASVIAGGIAGLIALLLGQRTVAFGPCLIAGSAAAVALALMDG